jgi:GTP-binding protein
MIVSRVSFEGSVYKENQLPAGELPEIAFAGRSNVGKSSLINKLVNRRSLVKVSARPGKTQALNFFLVNDNCYFVDLPGYGFAKVPKKMKQEWQGLIGSYLENRQSLRCVVVIVDVRHAMKVLDYELIDWLRSKGISHLVVYTKIDKLSRNQCARQAQILDSSLRIDKKDRLLFSAKTGEGKENLLARLDQLLL